MSKLSVAFVRDVMNQQGRGEISFSRMVELLNEEKSANEFPRRCRLDLLTPAELAIVNAVDEVEKVGADVRLTNAVIKLGEARNFVADFVDGIE